MLFRSDRLRLTVGAESARIISGRLIFAARGQRGVKVLDEGSRQAPRIGKPAGSKRHHGDRKKRTEAQVLFEIEDRNVFQLPLAKLDTGSRLTSPFHF